MELRDKWEVWTRNRTVKTQFVGAMHGETQAAGEAWGERQTPTEGRRLPRLVTLRSEGQAEM